MAHGAQQPLERPSAPCLQPQVSQRLRTPHLDRLSETLPIVQWLWQGVKEGDSSEVDIIGCVLLY